MISSRLCVVNEGLTRSVFSFLDQVSKSQRGGDPESPLLEIGKEGRMDAEIRKNPKYIHVVHQCRAVRRDREQLQ